MCLGCDTGVCAGWRGMMARDDMVKRRRLKNIDYRLGDEVTLARRHGDTATSMDLSGCPSLICR